MFGVPSVPCAEDVRDLDVVHAVDDAPGHWPQVERGGEAAARHVGGEHQRLVGVGDGLEGLDHVVVAVLDERVS